MVLNELPIEEISLSGMPFYHRHGATHGNTYIRCGQVRRGGNEPYCFTEEKQCANHICRVLCPGKVFENATVIRDDGTVWQIWFSAFIDVRLLKVRKEDS